jgi:hypothetical protein
MKKYLMSLLALVLGVGMIYANPVSESQAKYVGQQFVQAKFEQSRQSNDLTLVYTGTSYRGEACFYVFNVGNTGFVMVSADDYFRPIVGYSMEGIFPVDNMPGGLRYLLDNIIVGRNGHYGNATPQVAAEWELVTKTGRVMSKNGGRSSFYLLETKWDQDSPYNLYCPEYAGGPGGRCYAGCVATAMSQIMKYWNHPLQGQGSVTYNSGGSQGYPYFPGLTANFGATTYDWDNMPATLSNSSAQIEKEAVGTLMYHCGVAVHMNYAPDGSGAQSTDVPFAISNYFKYTNQAVHRERSNFSYADWYRMLKEHLDMGWPVYSSGCDADTPPGCHAFVCDGYDDAGLMHWNFGWSGTGNAFIDFDETEYSAYRDAAVFNFVPADIYNESPKAPTNFTVTPAANNELKATLTWTNPTTTLNNTSLSSIDQIVVVRDGRVIYTEDNVTPGATMTVMDNEVPRFDVFQYEVYAVFNGRHGRICYADKASFGPTCGWTINITQAAMNGFRGAAIHAYNASGNEIAQITTTNSAVQAIPVDMPIGHVSFGWSAQMYGDPFNIAFLIKDSQNNTIYSYSGSTADMAEGIFYEGNNSCGNAIGDGCPFNLVAVVDEENPNNIHVSWDPITAEGYGYTVYRDGLLHRLIPEGTSFIDENTEIGGHCYKVSYFYYGGENGQYSNESCATSGACYAPTDFTFQYVGDTYKIKLLWQKPEPHDGLSGYYLYRKFGEDGTYERIKVFNANSTNFTDNTATQEGDYYYQLYAYYQSMDCFSAPAAWIYDPNQFYLHAYYSADAVNEQSENAVSIFPNPTTSRFTVEGQGMNHIAVYNLMGQKVYEMECRGESVDINLSDAESGIYMVRISTVNGEVTKRITVIR